jgi:hypothetical protein
MEIVIVKNAIDAVVALYGRSSYDKADTDGNVTWKDGHETTAEETSTINAKVIELQAEYDAQEYARNRIAEYPSQGDQNDMIYKDNLNGTTTHKDAVETVKTKWPKDNSGPVE